MPQKMKAVVAWWHKEMLLVFVALGLFAVPPMLEAQTCGSDKNHYHQGADHCDSGGSGCTVVCP